MRFAIDRGGTFTDVYAQLPDGRHRVLKLLSEDPANYPDAPREGIRRIIEEFTGEPVDPTCVDTSLIEWIRMGTTVATNALLEHKGVPVALVTTKGFEDVLQIGNQSRLNIFDLQLRKAATLYECVIGIDERVRIVHEDTPASGDHPIAIGVTGDTVELERVPPEDHIRHALQHAYDEGIRSLCIAFLHSYTYPHHEQAVARVAREMGFAHVSVSSELMPMVKLVPRGSTALVDAYLTPLIKAYVQQFAAGFDDNFAKVNVSFMSSDGGLSPVDAFTGFRSILSGPAGGVIGYARTTYGCAAVADTRAVIGFDMGGTSTDVSRYDGHLEHVWDCEIAGVVIQAPQLDIQTVAAGGGSRLHWQSGLFVVGPDSAGAHPGPVCYRKPGGCLAVTDANLMLGRLLPDFFPKIFGPNEDEPLDVESTRLAFAKLTHEINADTGKDMTPEEVALGFIRVANEAMCRPIRSITEAKGYVASEHVLACFGGAGAQHACAIARSLGITRVHVHRFAGILSAYGLGLADVVVEQQEPCSRTLCAEEMSHVDTRCDALAAKARQSLRDQGFGDDVINTKVFLNLRYNGTDTALMTAQPDNGDYTSAFEASYQREYGFVYANRDIVVDDIRVRGTATSSSIEALQVERQQGEPEPLTTTRVFFDGKWFDTRVYALTGLGHGCSLEGPVIITNATSTILVEPNCTALVLEDGSVSIDVSSSATRTVGTELDEILLSVFAHRFMSIAEQMGRTLQRTSTSTNIKERLDFSCALFGPDGGLVANAPHLPVHLGSMQEAVRWQVLHRGADWREGQVVVTNNPVAGGTHLPDITVITPVYEKGECVFYVASRGHHADIGGISPGSMPPHSKCLEHEGAAIASFVLVQDGVFQEQGITELLRSPADLRSKYGDEMSGTRNLSDNLNDLKAQVAANHKGIVLMGELIGRYGLPVVQSYMHYVQDNCETAVRDMLRDICRTRELRAGEALTAQDYMDDGTRIVLSVRINGDDGSAVFDFTGTDPEVYGNTNAPFSITYSAVIYCLRCMVQRDIPLNQGCLTPIDVIVPPGSILCPSATAAVVGGNVLTSQRVTDVIFQAFQACACSQGCMNNFTFGDDSVGYYETIAGGGGAGPSWHGTDGVHSHMTNTRITDAELMERRYPVQVCQFSIRHGSGGRGRWNGGCGVIRELRFLKPMSVGILSERRALAPKGLLGGGDGARGRNLWIHVGEGGDEGEERVVNLGPKNAVRVSPGDRIRIETPGAGAFGSCEEGTEEVNV